MNDKTDGDFKAELKGLLDEAITDFIKEEKKREIESTTLKENPFISRWKLDDPQWLKQRKKNWKYIKENLLQEGKKTKALKHFKAFYIEGVEPCEARGSDPFQMGFGAYHRLALTPSSTKEEVLAIVDHVSPDQYLNCFDVGLSGRLLLDGEQELMAASLFPDQYEEKKVLFNQEEYDKGFSADMFVKEYERNAYYFLTTTTASLYFPCQYIFNHYLSCIDHLEQKGEPIPHHEWFPNLLSCLFNFVEPRASLGEQSNVAKFAEKCVKRLSEEDVPKSLQAEIKALGENRLAEYHRGYPAKESAYFVNKHLVSDWAAPYPRVFHGSETRHAIELMVKSLSRVGLIPEHYSLSKSEEVDISRLLTDEFVNQIGYAGGQPVPAYRLTVWFEPDMTISNNPLCQFGADFIILVLPKELEVNEDTPELIYYPRLSNHYSELYPTEALLLKERQFRQDVFDQSGKYLLRYSDETDELSPEEFCKSPELPMGYNFFQDYKSGTMELAIEGPDVDPWKGEPLPPLNLENINVDG